MHLPLSTVKLKKRVCSIKFTHGVNLDIRVYLKKSIIIIDQHPGPACDRDVHGKSVLFPIENVFFY